MTPVIGISREKLEVITAAIDGLKAWSINTKALASHELHVNSWCCSSLMSVHLTWPACGIGGCLGHKMTGGVAREPAPGSMGC